MEKEDAGAWNGFEANWIGAKVQASNQKGPWLATKTSKGKYEKDNCFSVLFVPSL